MNAIWSIEKIATLLSYFIQKYKFFFLLVSMAWLFVFFFQVDLMVALM